LLTDLMNDWEIGGTRNKWVCPSDRHLQLRAQLKSGWSVRTTGERSPSGTKQNNGLTESEKEHIKAVLARAENGKLREQQRIGKMIDRLEKMKALATGNGVTQCYLCSTDFGLLAPKSYAAMCSQCRKYVCQKNCGLETYDCVRRENVFLCKICSEYREVMWKKSGAWFYKEIPEFVKPMEDAQEMRSPPNLRAMDKNGFSDPYVKLYLIPGASKVLFFAAILKSSILFVCSLNLKKKCILKYVLTKILSEDNNGGDLNVAKSGKLHFFY
uniref:RabBD domain-containing protein n=1 Tax=Gongylonema pulchrum TaxID=637853 RepID=A0A183CU99_9BILA